MGDLEYAALYAGGSCRLIHDIKPAGQIRRKLVTEAQVVLAQMGDLIGSTPINGWIRFTTVLIQAGILTGSVLNQRDALAVLPRQVEGEEVGNDCFVHKVGGPIVGGRADMVLVQIGKEGSNER